MKSILPLKIDRVWFKNAGEILLENITLRIEKGLPKILMGANGSGKTLLMRVAHGLLMPTQGRVSWADNEKSFGSVRQTMVFQKPIMLRRTVKENLLFALNGEGSVLLFSSTTNVVSTSKYVVVMLYTYSNLYPSCK